jgi:hypothetical protein
MRRRTTHLKRRLFDLAAAVSLLLCVASVALWVRSYFATEWLVYQKAEPSHRLWWKSAFVSGSGQLYLGYARVDFDAGGLVEKYQDSTRAPEGFGSFVSGRSRGGASFPKASSPRAPTRS